MKPLLLLFLTLSLGSARDLVLNILNPTPDTPRTGYLVQQTFSAEIKLPKRNFTPRIPIPTGDLSLSLVAALPAEGTPPPTGAPKIRIPADWQRVIVVLIAAPSNPVFPVRPLVLNENQKGYQKGDILACNFSQTQIIANLGKNSTAIKPGQRLILTPPDSDGRIYHTTIDRIEEGKTLPLFSGKWRKYDDRKQILFITPSHRPGRPRISSLLLPL